MNRWKIYLLFVLGLLTTQAVSAQTRTLEEATQLSKATGRPIFAMAGRET